LGLAAFGVTLFVPAGTFDYWQAWVFLTMSTLPVWIVGVCLMRNNPAALERRMRAGPLRETRMVQQLIASVIFLSLIASIVFSALDHRIGWSSVPVAVCLVGDALVAIGLGLAMLVIIQNSYAGTTVTVETEQRLVSAGLYRLVRHPMYTGHVIMTLGIPLALGSYWGLAIVIPGLAMLPLRIQDEEGLLVQELSGYREYAQHVPYRMLPYVW
jgi:protein-S-isoprenylcysteine O-methyltransferase Ste14